MKIQINHHRLPRPMAARQRPFRVAWLRAARLARGWTQEQLAEEAAGQVDAAYCLNAVAMAMHRGTVAALAAYLKNRPDMRGMRN